MKRWLAPCALYHRFVLSTRSKAGGWSALSSFGENPHEDRLLFGVAEPKNDIQDFLKSHNPELQRSTLMGLDEK